MQASTPIVPLSTETHAKPAGVLMRRVVIRDMRILPPLKPTDGLHGAPGSLTANMREADGLSCGRGPGLCVVTIRCSRPIISLGVGEDPSQVSEARPRAPRFFS